MKMTYQSKNMGGFRPLETNEVEAVSGGGDTIIDVFGVLPVDGGGQIYGDLLANIGFGGGGVGSANPFAGTGVAGAPGTANGSTAGSFVDENGDGEDDRDGFIDTDGDGIPDTIVVTGNPSVLDGYVLAPTAFNGIDYYMYPALPNGEADLSQPPVLTPEGQQAVCDAYADWAEANGWASVEFGGAGTAVGLGNTPAGAALGGISFGLGAWGLLSQPPAHCD